MSGLISSSLSGRFTMTCEGTIHRVLLSPPTMALFRCLFGVQASIFSPSGHIEYDTSPPPIDHLVEFQPITSELVATYWRELNGDTASLMPPQLRQDIEAHEYLIVSGDVLSIIVYSHPELTIPAGSKQSSEDAGNTVDQDGYMIPQVNAQCGGVQLQEGVCQCAVVTPGTAFLTGMPLVRQYAISHSSGVTDVANWHKVILRGGLQGRDFPLCLSCVWVAKARTGFSRMAMSSTSPLWKTRWWLYWGKPGVPAA